ncbi:uncharacterized protein TRIVIDRAFT_223654 [Trichoderma virens Gv29-8]|uniref:Uncharacterized protein n=1 Tax=Hypocrea virens (strain Gv29-8 / FGSC 10586) TaxID=413071 RepID=G9MXS4_HYPVG|nr:uncharacterized protein TRIVIDRAFT_223654 [Trichoderma virens Gv29-8]EHK20685.1 hypothetical protein TRIVIDRAFT_223654 [Trichoderma virens Gv29-8]
MGIHEDARKGTLVGSTLTGYIEGNPNIVNEWDPVEGMTPLAAAVIEGHAEVVKQLLRRRAKPDAPCKNGETPLLLAAWKTSSNRSKIIQLLLNIKKMPQGYVDATCKIANGNTPLMFILSNTNPIDLESVRLLRKAGASLTLENNDGVSAEEMAEESGDTQVKYALRPEEEQTFFQKSSAFITSLLLYVVAWVVNGSKETNAADFAANVDNFVQENPILERFFKGKKFIQELAKKASDLENDPSTPLGSKELLPKTIKVNLHQQAILCGNGSMRFEGRFDSLKKLVFRITLITTRILPADEGVAICFINQDVNDATNLTLDQIVKMLEPMKEKRGGDTETGTTLRKKILEPMVYKKLSEKNFERPLLISILTDGQPSGEKKTEFVDAVLECGQRLEEAGYPRQSVKFLVAQIGTAKSATKFLESLRSNEQLKDVMFCTTDQLDAKLSDLHKNERDLDRWLLETLFSTIKDAE